MYNTDLYDHLLQSQSSQYSLSEMTKTLVVCGELLLKTSGFFLQTPPRVGLLVNRGESDSYMVNHIFASDSPTWSDVETTYSPQEDTNNDVTETFNVLNKLAFLEGDAVAEKEADQFFSQVQVKTKKIMVSRKA